MRTPLTLKSSPAAGARSSTGVVASTALNLTIAGGPSLAATPASATKRAFGAGVTPTAPLFAPSRVPRQEQKAVAAPPTPPPPAGSAAMPPFDPLKQHRPYCPWVVCSAPGARFDSPSGWQRTLDALEPSGGDAPEQPGGEGVVAADVPPDAVRDRALSILRTLRPSKKARLA